MARQRGAIKSLPPGKRFGFIELPTPTGGAKLDDVFFLFGAYPKGQTPTKGDEVEFDIEQTSKGSRAVNINVVSKASGSPSPAQPTATASTGTKNNGQTVNVPNDTLDGKFVFGEPVEKDSPNGKYDELLVAVVVKKDAKPIKGATVQCKLWDNPLGPIQQVITPENGIVFFVASLAKDAVLPYFEATLTYGRETKAISAYWGPTVPQPAAPTQLPTTLEIKQGSRMIGDTVTFVTKADGKPCKGAIRVEISEGFEKLTNLATGEVSATSPVVWDSDDHGILNIKIATKECYHEVRGTLVSDPAKTAQTEVYDV